ncbi:MAG: LysR family transcriptional regulator [Oscillospiraceae bacterium]|nr:LysR family transcriptional regulator [Oscillospiraceae bacterium]
MDLILLKYFHVVAREGSFMAAAQKLGYAQSNLSTRIRQLEESYGTELFIRGRSGVTLTDKGRILYDYAEKLLSLSLEAEGALKENSYSTGQLTITAMESAAITFLPALLAEYHRDNPNISVCVKTGTSDAGVCRLLENEVDLAFVVGRNDHDGLCAVPVKKEKLVLVTAVGEDIGLQSLLGKQLLVFPQGCAYRRVLERMLTDKGIAATHLLEFTSLGAILASVSAGLGSAVFPESAIQAFEAGSSLRTVELPEEYRYAEMFLLYRSQSAGNKTVTDFIQMIRNQKEERS